MKQFFTAVDGKSTIREKIIEYSKNEEPWFPYYNFIAKPIPYDILEEDPLFKWMKGKYEYIAGVIKVEPYTTYDWHIDTRRGVGINMILSPQHPMLSKCLFRVTKREATTNFTQLIYEPDVYYIFNTQKEHMVINFKKARYMLSIEFYKDKNELTYEQLCQDIKLNYEKNRTK
jgi:hypothetical protein